jgi:hypothetical protein
MLNSEDSNSNCLNTINEGNDEKSLNASPNSVFMKRVEQAVRNRVLASIEKHRQKSISNKE